MASPDSARLTASQLAGLAGVPLERVGELASRGVIHPDDRGTFEPGDAHRIRVVEGFGAAGVDLDVLVRAQEAGVITVDYYDQLHPPPGRPSGRTYGELGAILGAEGDHHLASVFGAFGIAEPDPTTALTIDDEAFLEDVVAMIRATDQPDLLLRVLRQFGEATRRASVASLEIYAEVIERLDPSYSGVPSQEVFDRHFLPWARVARALPGVAEWLTAKHVSREIDAYSIQSSELMLEQTGFVAQRPDTQPAVAFVDLSGFTTLAQERGDAIAADVALRLADAAAKVALGNDGRVVKLLGDGVLLRFDGFEPAVGASLALLDDLVATGLPKGHAGVAEGPLIARDGDVFGRTVNLAARISDVAPTGRLYVPADSGQRLAGRYSVEAVGPRALPGLGEVQLAMVSRPGPSPN